MNATAMTLVTDVYENTRKPVSRAGLYPWSFTVSTQSGAETHTFATQERAEHEREKIMQALGLESGADD
jgi:hypothetical protein